MDNARNHEFLNFKAWEIDHYRGMPIWKEGGKQVFSSARDIGNYHVDRPKCIKVKDEKLALTIIDEAAHGKGFVGRSRFQSLCGL